jgi:hypothetical protein
VAGTTALSTPADEPAPQADASIEVLNQFSDKNWRMANLYWILDEDGNQVHFAMNDMQRAFMAEIWYLNCLLKARQHGFTTLIDLWILDECVFYPNQTAGIIAHAIPEAQKIFRSKIKYPYDNLPEQIRLSNHASNDTAQELVFANKSSISVSTSMRSGTLQYLHVSEFGKISARYPEKAEEVVTGSFNTVHPGNYIFVESSAEGRTGHFFELCKRSQDLKRLGRQLTKMDFKFQFFPWWINPKYMLPPEETKLVVFLAKQTDYFKRIEKIIGKQLTLDQRAWYVKKKEVNGELMNREYPSTPEEAFEASIKGSYFGEEMAKMREERRIGRFPHEKGLGVDTWWDIGIRDKTAIIFTQTVGRECRAIDYHEATDRSLVWHIQLLEEKRKELGYVYRHHTGPHDLTVRDYGTGKIRWETAKSMGIRFQVGRQFDLEDQIDAARNLFSIIFINEETCSELIDHLDGFRKEWNEHLGQYNENPLHNEHCFTADTRVLTSNGTRRMDELDGSGKVLTPCGWKPYRKARRTLLNAPLVEVTFDDGFTVRCTPDHLFLTESGWKSAESLRRGSLIRLCSTQPRSTSTGASSSNTRNQPDISPAVPGTKSSIAPFGRGLSALSRRVATFIIEITSPRTICFQTLSACQGMTIFRKRGSEPTPPRPSISPPTLKSGFWSGIAPTLQKSCACAPPSAKPRGSNIGEANELASSAASSSSALTGPARFARSIAAGNAVYARIKSVRPLDYCEDTWCIQVPDEACFCLENGAVVHNSHGASAFMLLAMYLMSINSGKARAQVVSQRPFPT